jgi:TM2 domain-containing membrane protein YozV
MNIIKDIISGASRQFGREFGRAGANAILKGSNYYTVQGKSDTTGRIKPSDSDVVRAIKEINKIKFVTTNKANISRLISLTDMVTDQLNFNDSDTLDQIDDINTLVQEFNEKFEHGRVLIDDDYKDKSLDFLQEKRQEFITVLNQFNTDLETFVKRNLALAIKTKKSKSKATWLSCPFLFVGLLGFHKFYLKELEYGILYVLLSWTFLSVIFSFVNFIQLLSMSQDKFDEKYNTTISYYKQFNFNA